MLVSATIRMAGAPLGARRIDLDLHFFRGEQWLVQRIEPFECFAEALGGRIASALLAGFQEIDEIFHFRTLLGRQRLQLLDQGLNGLSVHG